MQPHCDDSMPGGAKELRRAACTCCQWSICISHVACVLFTRQQTACQRRTLFMCLFIPRVSGLSDSYVELHSSAAHCLLLSSRHLSRMLLIHSSLFCSLGHPLILLPCFPHLPLFPWGFHSNRSGHRSLWCHSCLCLYGQRDLALSSRRGPWLSRTRHSGAFVFSLVSLLRCRKPQGWY